MGTDKMSESKNSSQKLMGSVSGSSGLTDSRDGGSRRVLDGAGRVEGCLSGMERRRGWVEVKPVWGSQRLLLWAEIIHA
jgi:hypothetical protein